MGPAPVILSVAPVAEVNGSVLEGNKTAVGDGDPVRVPGQLLEHLIRPSEGRLRMDDPLFSSRRGEER